MNNNNTNNTNTMETTNTTNVYTLTKTELKSGKFQYVVTDQNGNVISNRTSARHYVACTAHGRFYFGRLDLIGKGDHGNYINRAIFELTMNEERWTKAKQMFNADYTIEDYKLNAQNRLTRYNQIAYLNQ